jgi:hypothetical protein
MSKLKRVGIVLGIGAMTICTYLWLFGSQTFFTLESRKIGREIPIVNSSPVALTNLETSRAEGRKISFKGIQFEVPWNDVDLKKSRVAAGWGFIFFNSGKSIIVCVTPPNDFMTGVFRDKAATPQEFAALYGPDVLQSDYEFKKAIFETTPNEINLFTPSGRAAGLTAVLIVKAIMPPTTDWAIYSFKSSHFKGFQLGDPQRRPRKMSVELFGEKTEIEINFDQPQSGPTPITQADINRIAQSAQTVPGAEPSLVISPGGAIER